MKTRIGFVSNSSSTSFVVAMKKGEEPCPHCHRRDPNFLDMIESLGSNVVDSYEATQLLARGAEAMWLYIKTHYNESRWETRFSRWLELEKKGYEMAFIEISYHDEATNEMLKSLTKTESAFILWSDHEGDKSANI